MRVVAHLSDFHFGRVDRRLLDPLAEAVHALSPHLVAISGDLTQRARTSEFCDAREFLKRLPGPQIVVPGNHDVPLHDVMARFLTPLAKFRRYITEDLEPLYRDEQMIVSGLNTARSLTVKGGRINRLQVARVFERMCVPDPRTIRIVVTHHPFDLPAGHSERDLLGRAYMAVQHLSRCGADVFLAGHLHLGFVSSTAARYRIAGHAALVVQAGTAASTRGRGELNSFNVLRIAWPNLRVERFTWDAAPKAFRLSGAEAYVRTSEGWQPGNMEFETK